VRAGLMPVTCTSIGAGVRNQDLADNIGGGKEKTASGKARGSTPRKVRHNRAWMMIGIQADEDVAILVTGKSELL